MLDKIFGGKKEVDTDQIISMHDLINVEYREYLKINKKDKRAYNFGEWFATTYPNALIYKRLEEKP